MAWNNFLSNIIYNFCEKILAVPESHDLNLGNPQKFIIIRQHNQLGDLLAGVSLFRAIKEKFPESHITLIVSPLNHPGIVKNKFIDRIFIFDKKKIYNPFYFYKFVKLLREEYDLVIVPVTVSVSFTSNLLARFSSSKIRIGPRSLNGKINRSAFLFDRRISIDWRKHPDSNVAERILDILKPFGITTNNYRSEISFDNKDIESVSESLKEINMKAGELLIGFHVGAGKAQNRWSLQKYISLIKMLDENYKVKFYLTGSTKDKEEIKFLQDKSQIHLTIFANKPIPVVAALISKSDLFICNDTGIMHVAGSTDVPQISIFGPTNPFNWAPIGRNKYFIRKSELIDDVSVQDVFALCNLILAGKGRRASIAK